jgi:hypothetical protein
LADNKHFHRLGYQQSENSRLPFYPAVVSLCFYHYQRAIRMAKVKLALIICDMLGIPVTFLGIAANIDNVKSAILFLMALIYLGFRTYFFVIRQKQSVREKDIDLWHKEQNKQERINRNKKSL